MPTVWTCRRMAAAAKLIQTRELAGSQPPNTSTADSPATFPTATGAQVTDVPALRGASATDTLAPEAIRLDVPKAATLLGLCRSCRRGRSARWA